MSRFLYIVLFLFLVFGCSSSNKDEGLQSSDGKSFSSKNKDDSNDLGSQILRAIKDNNKEKVQELALKALESNPKAYSYWRYSGIFFLKNNEYDLAKFYLDEREELGDRSPSLYSNRAIYYFQKGKEWEAVNELQKALAEDSYHENSNMLMAEILSMNKNYHGAYKYLDRLAERGINTPPMLRMYGASLIAKNNLKKAENIFASLRNKSIMGYESFYNYVWVLVKLAKNEQAQKLYDDLHKRETMNGVQKKEILNLLAGKKS